jgi:hypothetical protein
MPFHFHPVVQYPHDLDVAGRYGAVKKDVTASPTASSDMQCS